MKFGKGLLAATFVGCTTSLKIKKGGWGDLTTEDQVDAQYDWDLWYQMTHEDFNNIYSGVTRKATSFCRDNLKDYYEFCEDEVAHLISD